MLVVLPRWNVMGGFALRSVYILFGVWWWDMVEGFALCGECSVITPTGFHP
jgi:hypothetical protein